MRLPTLFRKQTPRAYNYKPRYYDERKERLEALIKSKESRSDENYSNGFRRSQGFKDDWKAARKSSSDKNSRLRLIVIFILLLLFAWYALKELNLETLI